MADVIPEREDDLLATHASLIERLKDCDDQASWQEFFDRYRGLIFRFALKAGCTETEIRHTVVLATTTLGFPSMMKCLSWVDDVLKDAA